MRFDLQIIASWIEPGSRVIDLGCGEGELLKYLISHKKVTGNGIEHNESRVALCIENGLSVLQGDINAEVLDYPDNTFDYVILSQTLQQVYEPDTMIRSMLRIGKKGIVSFPNFSHWQPPPPNIPLWPLPLTKSPVSQSWLIPIGKTENIISVPNRIWGWRWPA